MLTGLGCEFTTASIVLNDQAYSQQEWLNDLRNGPRRQPEHCGNDIESAGTLG
jgi:hypothetical protein